MNLSCLPEWNGKQIELVFEGSMTDTQVKINSRKKPVPCIRSFYRFIYNVSDWYFSDRKKRMYLK